MGSEMCIRDRCTYYLPVFEGRYFPILLRLWAFFCTSTTYGHVVVEHLPAVLHGSTASAAPHSTTQRNQPAQSRQASTWYVPIALMRVRQRKQSGRASTVLQYRKHSTAQRNQPAQSRQVRADQNTTTQGSRQSWRKPANVVQHKIYKYSHSVAGVMREGFAFSFELRS